MPQVDFGKFLVIGLNFNTIFVYSVISRMVFLVLLYRKHKYLDEICCVKMFEKFLYKGCMSSIHKLLFTLIWRNIENLC